ncbi:probable rRNA-processing protein ebp2 homolog [Phtheirospermum japonicum]|uniref:Probable rRNA-processing protein ebp2 homolog n=1 Tax=Phtheirospermum japonicum TaxID=374723 RepID=A0A830B9Q4_9LAMI|nr:probable rRNA-processing protein ebp2 homolog [Phtheirospermum japonicum]
MEDDDPLVSDSESDSDSDQDDTVKLTEPSKTAINNKPALLDKLADISWPKNADWIHKLTVDIVHDQAIDVNDDLNRELAFFTQALDGAREALGRFQSMGLPFLRPSDYYAEMVKSDTHMEKVKGRLLAEKKRAEEADERRKSRENKKLAKEIQAQKQRERAKQKKDDIESVKNWRKQRKQSGFTPGEDGDFSKAFEDGKSFERPGKKRPGVGPGDRSGGKGGGGKKGFGGKRKERDFKDSKFGFGGRKGLKKQNTAETTNDFSGFSKGKFGKNKKQKV